MWKFKPKTNEKFIKDSQLKFADNFTYNDLVYVNSYTNIILFCKRCNKNITVTPNAHLHYKYGCKGCSLREKTKTKEQFDIDANEVHGEGTYDYSQSKYVNNETYMDIRCPRHNKIFTMKPNTHLSGSGCKDCYLDRVRWTLDIFVSKSLEKYGDYFDFSDSIYKNAHEKITFKCRICNDVISRLPHCHLDPRMTYGCNTCFNIGRTKTNEQFVEESNDVHGVGTFDYSKSKYVNYHTDVIIGCNTCGKDFTQQPANHIYNEYGCSHCKKSKGEKLIEKILIESKIDYIPQHEYPDCKNINTLHFDFFLPKYNLEVEYDGEQHTRCSEFFGGKKVFEETQLRDKIKNEYCLKNKINLLRIPYTFSFDRIPLLIEKVLTNPVGVKQNLSLNQIICYSIIFLINSFRLKRKFLFKFLI